MKKKSGEGAGGDGYEVGKNKPPKHTRFTKGDPRAKMGGRPKKVTPAHGTLDEELERKVNAVIDGKRTQISARMAINRSIVQRAAKGDPQATAIVAKLEQARAKAGPPPPTKEELLRAMEEEVQ